MQLLDFRRLLLPIVGASLFFVLFAVSGVLRAQTGTAGTISGVVKDPSGASVVGATVTIADPVSGYMRMTTTGGDGMFAFANVPFNPYHLTVVAPGFDSYTQDVAVRSGVPIQLALALKLGTATATVTVTENASDILEVEPTTHTDIDRQLFDKLPLESPTSSISSLITLAAPGVVADSNGLFHGLGDHAENSFSVDGQPITDQQSKVFSNQIPESAVQSLEVIEGAPPAEYGDKTSLVAKVTTRSGLGLSTPNGNVTTSYGSFGTDTLSADLGWGGPKWGNFFAADGIETSRFLDPPQFVATHDKGNEENFFDRVDYKPATNDSLQSNFQFTRSWFQTPNSDDQLNEGVTDAFGHPVPPADQRSQIKTFDIAPSWTHLFGSTAVYTLGGFVRQDQFNYYPSPDPFADFGPIQTATLSQSRRLTNWGLRTSGSYVKGIHNIQAGLEYEQTGLSENDGFGIVDPGLLASLGCLNASHNPIPNTPCAVLAPYDLTRGAGTSDFVFEDYTAVKEFSLYGEDEITKGPWTFNIGLRGDFYNGLSTARQAEPRLGAAYKIKYTNTVLKLSYAHTMETPFNENLIVASLGCNTPVVADLFLATTNTVCTGSPVTVGLRNEYHVGLQQAFGKYFSLDGEYIWKYTHGAYDFSVLGNTPVTYPIEWLKSKIPGFAVHGTLTNIHGLTAYIVLASVAARFFNPQIAGLGATVGGAPGAVFRIDHDEKFEQTTHVQYDLPLKKKPWIGFNWRYDSGMVVSGVPDVAAAEMLTPFEQVTIGFACNGVPATLQHPITTCNGVGTSTLITLPQTGTESDDSNPDRVKPRSLFDVSVGDDDLVHFGNDRYKWSLRFTVINLTDKVALYNFLSTFSGTHFVTPRTETAELGFHF
jgi:hypothetical protein